MKLKYIILLFIYFILTNFSFSQFNSFDSVYTVAHSENFNYFNPEFEKTNSSDYFYTDYFTLAYEKHDTLESYSNIVFKKVLFDDLEDEVMITNDSIMNTEPAAGHSIILWQSDKNGNNDIYYSIYNDTVWNEPSALHITPQNETNPDIAEFRIPGQSPAYLILYESENDIHFKILRENIIIYDTVLTVSVSDPCSFPKIKMYDNRIWIGYLKNDNSVNRIILIKAQINSNFEIDWTSSEQIANSKSVDEFSFSNGKSRRMLMIYNYDTLGNYKNIGVYEDQLNEKVLLNYESDINISGKASVFAQSEPHYNSFLNVFCWLRKTTDSSMIIAASGKILFDSIRSSFYLGDSSQNSKMDLSSYFPDIQTNRFKYRLVWEKNINNRSALLMSDYSDGTAGINELPGRVDGFILYQNYPNPFNPSTNLEFGISELGFVSLKIFDVSGKEVAVLVNEVLLPGKYNYKFSTVNYQLSSGIYYYKLESSGFVETKRMVLLK